MERIKFSFFVLWIFLSFTLTAQTIEYQVVGNDFVGVEYSSAVSLDVNNDGLLDILYQGEYADNCYRNFLYLNNGDETFTLLDSNATGLPNLELGAIDTADFNGDGLTDVIMQGYTHSKVGLTDVYLNNGDSTFTALSLSVPPCYMGDVATCDFNNDGLPDFAVLGMETNTWQYYVAVYKNNGDSTFTEISTNFPGVYLGVVRWADYNGDGFSDLLITGFGSDFYTKIWRNNGDETFTETQISLYQSWLADVQWADFDNDGNIDLFLTGVGGDGSQRKTILYHNTGDSLVIQDTNFVGVSHSSVQLADFDDDGDVDIFYFGLFGDGMGTGDYMAKMFFNENGNFVDTMSIDFTPTYWGDCIATDFNNDTLIDLFISGNTYKNEQDTKNSQLWKAKKVIVQRFENISENGNLSVYPIPAGNMIFVADDEVITKVQILDLTGKILKTIVLSQKSATIDISALQSGVYLLQVYYSDKVKIRRIIIE